MVTEKDVATKSCFGSEGGYEMHKRKRFGKLSLAAVLCVAITGCTEKSPEPEVTPTPVPVQETQCATATPAPPTPTEIPYRNLGGMEIVIGDHWTPETLPFIHIPGLEEPLEVYRDEIMEKYNFKLTRRTVAGWGEMEEDYVASVQNREPIAHG